MNVIKDLMSTNLPSAIDSFKYTYGTLSDKLTRVILLKDDVVTKNESVEL